jgi:hypothetical protein
VIKLMYSLFLTEAKLELYEKAGKS